MKIRKLNLIANIVTICYSVFIFLLMFVPVATEERYYNYSTDSYQTRKVIDLFISRIETYGVFVLIFTIVLLVLCIISLTTRRKNSKIYLPRTIVALLAGGIGILGGIYFFLVGNELGISTIICNIVLLVLCAGIFLFSIVYLVANIVANSEQEEINE